MSKMRQNSSNIFTCGRAMIVLVSFVAVSNDVLAAGKIRAVLEDIGDHCSKTHAYEWRNPGELGDHELGRGEKAWRTCVYDGIRHQIIPASKLPEQYERAITQDLEFTKRIEAGEMTRFERWQKNRLNMQLWSANEQLAGNEESDKQRQQQEHLENFINNQMEDLLRVRPPVPRIHR